MEEKTHFAPASRSTVHDLMNDHELIDSQKFFSDFFGSIPGIGAIINKNRQIIFANNDLLDLLGLKSLIPILGKRPGEILSCVHSDEETGGCGTSMSCVYCGAVNTILESQRSGKQIGRETRITSMINGQMKSWDLYVKSTPVNITGQDFYILTLEDKSDEKRRIALERIFFHDIINIAGGLNGLLQILKDGTDPKETHELIDLSEEASRSLIEQIMFFKQLKAAEDGEMKVKIEKLGTLKTLNLAIKSIQYHDCAKTRIINTDKNSYESDIESDAMLLQRILINLLKNALEATEAGGSVTAGIDNSGDRVRFWIKNDSVMPKEVQMQIFQRSFSTKGKGRGIGTYSIKLLTENYLKGKVSFISNEESGTIFSLDIMRKFPVSG
jgi:nitrogen-specific signal transduction histidine kinase